MQKTIYFATTSQGKLNEARQLLGIDVQGCGLEIDEIQSLDPETVAIKKAAAYFQELKKPILVEDVALTFEALEKLPGTYINDFLKVLGNQGLIDLLANAANRKATAQTTLVFVDQDGKSHIFTGVVAGEIAREPKGTNGFGWDAIFIPEGETRTFGEMSEIQKAKYSMRAKALANFKEWLEGM
jgi:non-canonical purine NTP pyrophosphatase (RdgB/HAM1 family)